MFFSRMLILVLIIFYVSSAISGEDYPIFRPYAEIYNETIGTGREDYNPIALLQAYQGLRMGLFSSLSWDLYIKERLGGDIQRDYWNNRGEFSAGSWLRFSKKIFLGGFAEYVKGRYLGLENSENPNPYGLNYDDFRTGLVLWHGSDFEKPVKDGISFPFTFWDEVYGDAIYYRKDSHNYITYFNPRVGLRLIRYKNLVLDPYLVNYWMYDRNGDYWNNKADVGLGLRVKPFSGMYLILFSELLWGKFIDRRGRYENPNPQNYQDIRVGILFWYGWGY